MTKQFAQPTQGVSVAELLRRINEGEENAETFESKYTKYLRSKSSSLKHEFPNRIYSVKELPGMTLVFWKSKEIAQTA